MSRRKASKARDPDSRKRVILFGTGGFAEVAHVYLTEDSPYRVAGFTVDRPYATSKRFRGLPLVPFEEVKRTFPPDKFRMLIAVAYGRVNQLRAEKYSAAKAMGYDFITYRSSHSVCMGEVQVGENCFIFENQTIQPFVRIGDDVVIWSGNHLGHHSRIGDHCFIASHVVISGNVEIEPYCFLGINATIRDGVKVGRGSVIGAGALVTKDVEPGLVLSGPPAKLWGRASDLKRI